jgi:hypothetical protein
MVDITHKTPYIEGSKIDPLTINEKHKVENLSIDDIEDFPNIEGSTAKASTPQATLPLNTLMLWDKANGEIPKGFTEIKKLCLSGNAKVKNGLTYGMISTFEGDIEDLSEDWNLCDGSNGTPNLTDKFIIGAGNTFDIGDSGGSTTLSHSGANTTVGNHIFTQPSAHSNHTFTQPSAHSNHSTHTHPYGTIAVADHTSVATKQGSSSGNVVTTKTHTVSGSTGNENSTLTHSAHSGGDVDAHSAHSGGAVDAHSVGITQPSDHTSVRPPYYALAYIMYIGNGFSNVPISLSSELTVIKFNRGENMEELISYNARIIGHDDLKTEIQDDTAEIVLASNNRIEGEQYANFTLPVSHLLKIQIENLGASPLSIYAVIEDSEGNTMFTFNTTLTDGNTWNQEIAVKAHCVVHCGYYA